MTSLNDAADAERHDTRQDTSSPGDTADLARRLAAGSVDSAVHARLRASAPAWQREAGYAIARKRAGDPEWRAAADLLELAGYRNLRAATTPSPSGWLRLPWVLFVPVRAVLLMFTPLLLTVRPLLLTVRMTVGLGPLGWGIVGAAAFILVALAWRHRAAIMRPPAESDGGERVGVVEATMERSGRRALRVAAGSEPQFAAVLDDLLAPATLVREALVTIGLARSRSLMMGVAFLPSGWHAMRVLDTARRSHLEQLAPGLLGEHGAQPG